jgi:hypothetical protein
MGQRDRRTATITQKTRRDRMTEAARIRINHGSRHKAARIAEVTAYRVEIWERGDPEWLSVMEELEAERQADLDRRFTRRH